MAPLWNKSSNSERQAEDRNGESSMNDPDERTRLLSPAQRPPPSRDGYLDPDDPAVGVFSNFNIKSEELTESGIAVQSLDCSFPPISDRSVPLHHLGLVGLAAHLHLCLASGHAHSRLWLLRLCLHLPDHGEPFDCLALLHCSLKSNAGIVRNHRFRPVHRHDSHRCR